jgi:hypothetical protein
VLEDAHKFGASQIAYLATPKALHPLHGQIFKIQAVVAVRQLVSQLEEPITALSMRAPRQRGRTTS